jgi:hypothetical protein
MGGGAEGWCRRLLEAAAVAVAAPINRHGRGPWGLVGTCTVFVYVYLGGFAAAKERIRHTVEERDGGRHTRGLSLTLPEEADTDTGLSRGCPRTFDLLKWAWQDEDRSIKPALSGESSLHTRNTPIG